MVNNDSCCFAKILKVIEILQNSSTNPACCEEGCDKPFLGPNQNSYVTTLDLYSSIQELELYLVLLIPKMKKF